MEGVVGALGAWLRCWGGASRLTLGRGGATRPREGVADSIGGRGLLGYVGTGRGLRSCHQGSRAPVRRRAGPGLNRRRRGPVSQHRPSRCESVAVAGAAERRRASLRCPAPVAAPPAPRMPPGQVSERPPPCPPSVRSSVRLSEKGRPDSRYRCSLCRLRSGAESPGPALPALPCPALLCLPPPALPSRDLGPAGASLPCSPRVPETAWATRPRCAWHCALSADPGDRSACRGMCCVMPGHYPAPLGTFAVSWR